ncbi:MAG: hypothetical protein Q8S13_03475, partial [Dehalococcoidia bacterium]|nr:hypothetical protein [Dehalococcoidia bacterium]
RGGRVLRLPISVQGHTPLMREVANEMSRMLDSLPVRDPDPPIVSNISARLLTTAEEVREELSNHIYAAVQWARCVGAMLNQGASPFVEVGPGLALSKLVRRIKGDAAVFGTDDPSSEDLSKLAAAVPELEPSGVDGR